MAFHLYETNGKQPVILVSKDINLRIKADALGLDAEDYENGHIDTEDLYTGAPSWCCRPPSWTGFLRTGAIPPPEGPG